MNISKEAVEATARAAFPSAWEEAEWRNAWHAESYRAHMKWARKCALDQARAALEAAYPAIRHMAAREALDGLIAKHDQSASRHPEGSSAHFDEQRATFRIIAYRDAEYPEAD